MTSLPPVTCSATNDAGYPCKREATLTTCDPVGGAVCDWHKCRCSRPLQAVTAPTDQKPVTDDEAAELAKLQRERDELRDKLQLLRAVVGAVVADLENGDSLQARGELTGALMDTGLSTPREDVQRAWKQLETRNP